MATPSHHKDRARVHGRVEAEDSKGSRNLPTGKYDVISGKNVGCGRPAWRKGFSSPGVMKPGTSGLESVMPVLRNVLNERGRKQPEGTQEGASIPLLFFTGKVFVLRLTTSWVCAFPVFPTNKKNEPQFVLQTQKLSGKDETMSWGEEDQSGHTFPPQRPRKSTWTCGGGRLQGVKEFPDWQVRRDQWKKRWLWKARVEERLQFTRSDEARDERAGVGDARAAKRLKRERDYDIVSSFPLNFCVCNTNCGSHSIFAFVLQTVTLSHPSHSKTSICPRTSGC